MEFEPDCHTARAKHHQSARCHGDTFYIELADDRCAVAKFSKSRVCDKVPEGSILIFGDTLISLKNSVT